MLLLQCEVEEMRIVNKAQNIPTSTICIDYIADAFSSAEIEIMRETLSSENIKLATKSHMPQCIMGIDQLLAQISIYLPPDIVTLLCQTIITRGTYDCIKALIVKIFQIIKNKHFSKIKNGKILEDSIPNVHLVVGNNSIILPVNLDQEKFEYALDTFKDVINLQNIEKKHFSIYNEKTGCFKCYDEFSFITKIANETMKQQEEKDETTI